MRSIRPFCPSGLGAKRTGLLRIDTSDVLPTERGDLGISQQRHEVVFIVTQEAGNMWSLAVCVIVARLQWAVQYGRLPAEGCVQE